MIRNLFDRHTCSTVFLTWLIVALSIVPVLVVSALQAEEYRHHEAHEHGVASLNLAIDGKNLQIEFSSPAANIVGFEHHPRTEKQKAAVKKAMKLLENGDALFTLFRESEGRLVKSDVHTDIDQHGGDDHDSEHSDEKRPHDQNAGQHGKEHSEADEHQRHSEFKANYHFICNKPNKLKHISVLLFKVFPGIEHIEVQLLTPKKQTGMELTADNNRIPL